MPPWSRAHAWGAVAATVLATTTLAASTATSVPITCSKGPSGQHFNLSLTLPGTAAPASTYMVRIDGVDSGTISHTGLNYIRDMSTDYAIPSGTTYVEASARIISGTGTPNVAAGASVRYEAGMIRMVLPGHVDSGGSYTPPSIEFQLKVTAAANASLALEFLEYRVTANAFIVGDVLTVCEPTPKPYTLGVTRVAPAATP